MNRLAVVLSTLLALSPVLYREGIDLNTHSIDSSIVTINEVAVTPTDESSVDNTEVTDDAEEELEEEAPEAEKDISEEPDSEEDE